MKLWLLEAGDGKLWTPWYDKAFAFVVRAENEADARQFAASRSGDEGAEAWLDDGHSLCTELDAEGDAEVIICDFHSA